MEQHAIPLNVVCIVQFKEPTMIRVSPQKQITVRAAQLVFFRVTTTGQLCYRKPKAFAGFVVPAAWEEQIKYVWKVGQEVDLYRQEE